MRINVKEFMGTANLWFPGVESNDLRNKIAKGITSCQQVIIDFEGIELLTSSFLNSMIGSLYFDFTPQQIRDSMKVENMCQEDLQTLKLVVSNAKRFYNHVE